MNGVLVDEDGLTFEEWAEELFAYERCCECNGGAEAHEGWFAFGHWFAHCKGANNE